MTASERKGVLRNIFPAVTAKSSFVSSRCHLSVCLCSPHRPWSKCRSITSHRSQGVTCDSQCQFHAFGNCLASAPSLYICQPIRRATCLRERQFNGVTVNQRVWCEETMLGSLCLSRTDIYLFTAEHVHGTNKMSHLISTLALFETQKNLSKFEVWTWLWLIRVPSKGL